MFEEINNQIKSSPEAEPTSVQKKSANKSKPNLDKFYGTKWELYYRSRHPETEKICIVRGKMTIDGQGGIKISNPDASDFYSFRGKIEEYDHEQLILKLHCVDHENLGYTYIMLAISPAQTKGTLDDKILNGIYVKNHPFPNPTRVGAGNIVFRNVASPGRPKFLDVTISLENNKRALPFLDHYHSFEMKIKRLLFDRNHNFLSTCKVDLSKPRDFQKHLLKIDEKFASEKMALIDVYISCPIESNLKHLKTFNKIKKEVNNIINYFKTDLVLKNKQDNSPLFFRTPFDKDKIEKYRKKEDLDIIDPKICSLEIENCELFVMYYPDNNFLITESVNNLESKNAASNSIKNKHKENKENISAPSSCLIEAAWAIKSKVPCLFLVENEKSLPRYLRRKSLPKNYPLHICKLADLKPSKKIDDDLGTYVSLNKSILKESQK